MEPLIIALVSGSGTALVGLVWKAWRTARFGKTEDEALATKNAKVAVEAVSDVLDDLRKERVEQRTRILELEATAQSNQLRIVELEKQILVLSAKIEVLSEFPPKG